MPQALITMSAWTNLNLPRRKVAYVGASDPRNPYISPYYGDYKSFPQMLMQVGTKDIVNDTVHVYELAKSSGVDITQRTYMGVVHVIQALFPRVDEANEAWSEVNIFIEKL